jgi:hypothetical protein
MHNSNAFVSHRIVHPSFIMFWKRALWQKYHRL